MPNAWDYSDITVANNAALSQTVNQQNGGRLILGVWLKQRTPVTRNVEGYMETDLKRSCIYCDAGLLSYINNYKYGDDAQMWRYTGQIFIRKDLLDGYLLTYEFGVDIS